MSTKLKRLVFYGSILGVSIGVVLWSSNVDVTEPATGDPFARFDTAAIRRDDSSNRVSSDKRLRDSTRSASDNEARGTDGRLDLDALVHDPNNRYLLSLKGGEVQLCYGDKFDLHVKNDSGFARRTETYNNGNGDQVVTVYVLGDSYLKKYFNGDPDVNRLDLVYGRILSKDISLTEGVRIGMDKRDVLLKIFKPSHLFDSIYKVTIYEDERGEHWSSMIFKDNRLFEVRFDSDYEWIDKDLQRDPAANK